MPEDLQPNQSKPSKVSFYQLRSDEIMKKWPAIRPILAASMSPYSKESDQSLKNLKLAALSGRLPLWICVDDEQVLIKAMIALSVRVDPITQDRVVYIEALSAIEVLTEDDWIVGMQLIRDFARDAKAHKICGHVAIEADGLVAHYLRKSAVVTHQLLELPL